MIDRFIESTVFQAFLKELSPHKTILIEHLWGAPKALLATLISKATKKNVLIIAGTREDQFLDHFPFLYGSEILDFLPLDEADVCLDVVGKRMATLYTLTQKKESTILYTSVQALVQKTISKKTILPFLELWKVGMKKSFSNLPIFLSSLGYQRVPLASDKGQFALRGGILDIFPISAPHPYRLEFFGDEIETIRSYDPTSQRSIEKAASFLLSPPSELEILKKEKKGSSLLDYLGENTILLFDNLLAIEDEYVKIQKLTGSSSLYLSLEELLKLPLPRVFFLQEAASSLGEITIKKASGRSFYTKADPFQPLDFPFFNQTIESSLWNHPFEEVVHVFGNNSSQLEEILKNASTSNIETKFIVASSSEEVMIRRKFEEIDQPFPSQAECIPGYLPSGFVLKDLNFALIPTSELTQKRKIRRQAWRDSYHSTVSEFSSFSPGDAVVHFHHGIGKFIGIETQKDHLDQTTEFLKIEYASGSTLFVPISQSHLLSRYVGVKEEIPTLNVLGSTKWQKTCVQAQHAIVGYAKQLLTGFAERVVSGGFAYPKDSISMQMFEESFPFTETEDQLRAIIDIKKDMESPSPMDRLICGDVGYGKTEVAMRAAFKAAVDGHKQVAVLVPTTVLAIQHYESFKSRMSDFPIQIGVLSRFSTRKEVKETLAKVASGEIQILIGTHRLISKDVCFKDLGLLIIDEEQRFGVRAKEHLKSLKTGVDCLTLSATPIPRTLYFSLIGARQISVISTPPHDRLPIKTIIAERSPSLISSALIREFSRDGQVFFIHNRVETLPKIEQELRSLVSQARIVTGHGQMDAEEIDEVFGLFKDGSADLLLSTTIVENGIDIPNANTILIDRADTFGIADLYQLRGRVGRWNRPAYAYFLVPRLSSLPESSRKRLMALAETSGYGGGMKIALRDLEIRGAGDLLGVQQSGQVSAIGFHLYCKLLKKTVNSLQKEKPIDLIETKIEFPRFARIPEEYVPEVDLRMEFYYRLGNCSTLPEASDLLQELEDRFGKAPDSVYELLMYTRLKIKATELSILSIKIDRLTLSIETVKGKKTYPLPKQKSLLEFEDTIVEALHRSNI